MSYKVKRFVSAESIEDEAHNETIEHADIDCRNGDATHYYITVVNGEITSRGNNEYRSDPLADEVEAAVKEIAAKVIECTQVSVVLEDAGDGVYTFTASPENQYASRCHGRITAASNSSKEIKDD